MIEQQKQLGHDSQLLFDNRIEWLSIKDAAKLYPIGLNTFYKYKKNGLPVRKYCGKLMIKRSELDEFLERWAA